MKPAVAIFALTSVILLSACDRAVDKATNATKPGIAISLEGDDKAANKTLDHRLTIRGKIYTGKEDTQISGVWAKDGYIETVIPNDKPQGCDPENDQQRASVDKVGLYATSEGVIVLCGAVAYPGFVDGHAHLIGIGQRELILNLEGTSSIADLKARVAEELATTPAGTTLYGRGWIETGWPEERFPNRDDLDQVAPDNPVILIRADGHAAVVNSSALDQSNITDETPDPDGGKIERDATGRATGILIDNAQSLVAGLLAAPTPEQRHLALKTGAKVYAAYGWTGLHNMSVAPDNARLIGELEEAGEMPIRVYNALTPEGLDGLIETGIWEMNDGKITTRTVKYYIDGALGSRGAALKEPYSDQLDNSGLLLISEQEAKTAWRKAYDNGIQVVTHAIGDRGNALVLDWYGDVLGEQQDDPKWRIEHAQIVDKADIPRFAAQGIIASMQPSHAIGDLHFAPSRLGKDRLEGAYAWRSMTDAGVLVVGGSDAPVERGDPMVEFYAAVARKDLTGFSNEDWHGEQKLTRAEALKLFTLNPAIASFNETRMGTIELGKKADFTILSADIMTIPEDQIPAVKAVMTIVDGEIVFDGR